MKLFVISVCVFVALAKENSQGGDIHYIVGGVRARQNEFPWQIDLQVASQAPKPVWLHQCGGSLISDRWVATAAHCFLNLGNPGTYLVRVVAGSLEPLNPKSKSIQISEAAQVLLHPQWSPKTVMNDIALVKLKKPLKLNTAVSPISLPRPSDEHSFDGKTCVVSGWGRTTPMGPVSGMLMKANLPIVPNPTCSKCYRPKSVDITPNRICAGRLDIAGVGPCIGDSGGPLACFIDHSYQLAGITSFTAECGSKDYPAVFTRVSSYSQWIKQVISSN